MNNVLSQPSPQAANFSDYMNFSKQSLVPWRFRATQLCCIRHPGHGDVLEVCQHGQTDTRLSCYPAARQTAPAISDAALLGLHRLLEGAGIQQ